MGQGFAILVWDGWGVGLVRINPRLLTNGTDMYGNPNNYFSCNDGNKDELVKELTKDFQYWQIID